MQPTKNHAFKASVPASLAGPAGMYPVGVFLLLVLLLLPRLATSVGLPTTINFLHYPVTFVLYLVVLFGFRSAGAGLHIRIGMLLVAMWASAILNSAGIINIVVGFLLLGQPFLIVAIVTGRPWTERDIKAVERVIAALMLLHTVMAYAQFATTTNPDNVFGLFLNMGAGAHVAGAVGLSAGIYYFIYPVSRSLIGRWVFPIALASIVVIADAKQVLAVFAISLAVLSVVLSRHVFLLKFRQAAQSARFIIPPLIIVGLVSYFSISQTTIDRILRQAADGFGLKISVFSIISAYHTSIANTIFGLGPGHTNSRLGWMFPAYRELLTSLGGTHTPIAAAILFEDARNYLTNPVTGTSLFSLNFSWAGIWGDIGLFGVAVYLFAWIFIWRRFCADQLSKFFVLNALIFGMIFTWLEEPGYIGFIAILIGIRWQASRVRGQSA